ncbi:MAG: hypothetical protein V3U87_16035 [Methylococcaceae bacterium]
MSSNLLHISTDKSAYVTGEDVHVTATLDQWYPGPDGKVRLVIWVYGTGTHIADKYFIKPTDGYTVKWTVSAVTFAAYASKTDFDAQMEFGSLHADAKFTYTAQ